MQLTLRGATAIFWWCVEEWRTRKLKIITYGIWREKGKM